MNDFTMLYSGDDNQEGNWVDFIVMNKLRLNILDFKPTNGRIKYLRFKAKPSNMYIINVCRKQLMKTKRRNYMKNWMYYVKRFRNLTQLSYIYIYILQRQIGKEEYLNCLAEKFTTHDRTNKNGQMSTYEKYIHIRIINLAPFNTKNLVNT